MRLVLIMIKLTKQQLKTTIYLNIFAKKIHFRETFHDENSEMRNDVTVFFTVSFVLHNTAFCYATYLQWQRKHRISTVTAVCFRNDVSAKLSKQCGQSR